MADPFDTDVLAYHPHQHYLLELTPEEARELTITAPSPDRRYYAIIPKRDSGPRASLEQHDRHTRYATIALITLEADTIASLDFPNPSHQATSIARRLQHHPTPTTLDHLIAALDPLIDPSGSGSHTA